MSLSFRFAIISDPHIALPHTVWDHPQRFHLVEISIPALEIVLEQLEPLDLDFLLLPGDLTQHGEPENHAWLAQRLARLPYPAYVVPGNHDVVQLSSTDHSIGLTDFPFYYQKFGYTDPERPYYTCEVFPGVRLIGLNSNCFDSQGRQIEMGHLDLDQLTWLKQTLAAAKDELVLVMVHHNVIEHLPGQAHNSLGRRYMLENASELLHLLHCADVPLLFTGHLHIQDIAQQQGIHEITTGSLVSYPHPYRVLEFQQDKGDRQLHIESGRVNSVPAWPDLQQRSRNWMGDRSLPFMLKLLTQPPLELPIAEAEQLTPALRYFWADVANGDALFNFPEFSAEINQYFARFGAVDQNGAPQLIDNCTTLII
jgi:3',5'-cyclic AMP phosphodiesterase CpdA